MNLHSETRVLFFEETCFFRIILKLNTRSKKNTNNSGGGEAFLIDSNFDDIRKLPIFIPNMIFEAIFIRVKFSRTNKMLLLIFIELIQLHSEMYNDLKTNIFKRISQS